MQTETDITESVARFKQAHGVMGGTFSGGRINDFRKGWAVVVTSFGKAHYWVRSPFNLDYVKSGCGQTAATALMYGEGNVDRCKQCAKRLT